jgi:hypothetical protein
MSLIYLIISLCKIGGSHSGVDKDSNLLGYGKERNAHLLKLAFAKNV